LTAGHSSQPWLDQRYLLLYFLSNKSNKKLLFSRRSASCHALSILSSRIITEWSLWGNIFRESEIVIAKNIDLAR
jgi:hypothetical protein